MLVRNYTQLSKPVKVFGGFGEGKESSLILKVL